MKMLQEIIKNKIKEVKISKKIFPLYKFRNELKNSERDFKKALSKNRICLIAEIKRKSPSALKNKQFENKEFDIKKIAKIYTKYADAISVLTDKKFFGGTLEDIRKVSQLTSLPILRKDFVIDEYQIYESRFYKANAILLIASILPDDTLSRFINIAKSYNMECLVEVNTDEELKRVLDSGASIIGINNRNLNTLELDMGTTLRLADKIPKGKIAVSESGILSRDYVRKIAGKVDAILVGTLFMNSDKLEEEMSLLIK